MTTTLLCWPPDSINETSRTVTTATDVETIATELLAAYQAVGTTLPGIELQDEDSGESLSIAVKPDSWALIHTTADMIQHRSSADSEHTGSDDIRWEEITTIPRDWFIPQQQALTGIQHWLAECGLAPNLEWSTQAF